MGRDRKDNKSKNSTTPAPTPLERGVNTGPVDTPEEIAAQYLDNGPIVSNAKRNIREHNPGVPDTPGEIEQHNKPKLKPLSNSKDFKEQAQKLKEADNKENKNSQNNPSSPFNTNPFKNKPTPD